MRYAHINIKFNSNLDESVNRFSSACLRENCLGYSLQTSLAYHFLIIITIIHFGRPTSLFQFVLCEIFLDEY